MDVEDELITSLPIHLTHHLGSDVQLHQFPLLTRPLETPPSALRSGKRIAARIRPNARRLEIHVPADTRPEVWNAEKSKELGSARVDDDREKNQEPKIKLKEGEEPRLSEIRLRSEEIPHHNTYMLGIVRDGKLHLHPVTETHQFRPSLTYLDLLSRKNRRGGGNDSDSDDGPPPDPDDPNPVPVVKKEKKPMGEAREVSVTAKRTDDKSGQAGMSVVRREMLQMLRNEEDESWEPLEFCDVSTDTSGATFESVFSTSDEPLQCKSSLTSFINNIEGL
ncbi:DNA-directed RNA polymerase III subunit Rpc5 [Ephemerocybe angulata]|uniref:DNA-directed RNA polymerase III subunit Rpc5 n=1 Tax=Ephemerocybe angulata TaxID=980116 RepID=A0A8H6III7_9AGAR|nr:DNA-directed RNA polymerase III subunit Rpc5 [Tulosesus angulatus]